VLDVADLYGIALMPPRQEGSDFTF